MECSQCSEQAVFESDFAWCRQHFTEQFEAKVERTIRDYGLLSKSEKIMVAASGGKDSTTVMFLLKKLGYGFDVLAIDEGIHGYRDKTLGELKEFCSLHGINLRIVSYEESFGYSLDRYLQNNNVTPCRVCGVMRRYLLNRHTREYDKLATGHNMDDEAQSIFMNYMLGNIELAARLGPMTGVVRDAKFTVRVKPLYFCTEREVAAYAFLQNFPVSFIECPNAEQGFRSKVRDSLNELERKIPGTKKRLVENFVQRLPSLKAWAGNTAMGHCMLCGEPSHNEKCKACEIRTVYGVA